MALNSSPMAARNLSLLRSNTSRRISLQFTRHYTVSSSYSASSASSPSSPSSVSSDELKHFASLASTWWDPQGPSRILHLMNPIRHDFIASCLADSHSHLQNTSEHNGSNSSSKPDETPPSTESGLRYLDVGCGGGIFAESLARTIPSTSTTTLSLSSQSLASSLVAVDPSPAMIELARSHARKDPALYSHMQTGQLRYENVSLEDLSTTTSSSYPSSTSPSFDVITLFEVLEHVDPATSSPRSFLQQCLRLLRPGGWLIGSTIARTWPSFVVNQVIAEAPWPIGVVPRGTHEWGKFVNLDEVKGWAEEGLLTEAKERDSSEEGGSGMSKAYPRMGWKCEGAMYVPGLGWKLIPGSERFGNYFWGIQKTR